MSSEMTGSGGARNGSSGWLGPGLLWSGFVLALAFLLGFGWHCASVVRDVAKLRGRLEDRIGVVIDLSKLRGMLERPGAAAARERNVTCGQLRAGLEAPALPADARRLGRQVVTSACGAAASESTAETLRHVDQALALLRTANARTSVKLGGYWKQLNLLAVTSVIFGATTLLLAFVMAQSALRSRRSRPDPNAAASPTPEGPSSALPSAARTGRHEALQILIVDDDLPVARSLARILRQHRCEIAEGGVSALERLQQSDYDLIFCDVTMPDVSGIDVYEALQKEGQGREAKVVFVTGGAFGDRARNLLRSLPGRVLDKPFDVSAIRLLVATWSRARVNRP